MMQIVVLRAQVMSCRTLTMSQLMGQAIRQAAKPGLDTRGGARLDVQAAGMQQESIPSERTRAQGKPREAVMSACAGLAGRVVRGRGLGGGSELARGSRGER